MLKVLDNGEKDKLSKDGKFIISSTERAWSKAAVSVHLRCCNKHWRHGNKLSKEICLSDSSGG